MDLLSSPCRRTTWELLPSTSVTHNQIASATQALICSQHSGYRWLQAVEVKKHYSGELNKPFLAAYLLDVTEAFEMISARELLIQAGPVLYLPGCIVQVTNSLSLVY